MKALITTRSDLRWALAALPAVFLGHWIVIRLVPMLLHMALPDSIRAVLNLL
jgi:hypothetical protein